MSTSTNIASNVTNIKPRAPWTPENASRSRIKWYDPQRRFGFVQPHDGNGDVWFNWLTLLKNRIPEGAVLPDMPVAFTFEEPDAVGKQRSVVFMRIIED